MKKEIELGDTVQCIHTGFKGVAVAKTIFINECVQFSVVPKWDGKTNMVEMEMQIDSESLKIIKKKPKPRKEKEEFTGGPNRRAIIRRNY